MLRIFNLLTVLLFLFSNKSFSQTVDPYTGTAIISVPFAQLSDHDVSDNFGLVYQTRGVSIKSPSGYYGQGWSLAGGGSVSREVRGLPDDLNDTRKGWLYQSNTTVAAFTNSADTNSSTCSDENGDYNLLLGYNYTKDPEPDLFYYSVGGVSGSFVFNNSTTPTISLIPYRDIKIEPKFVSSSNKTIIGFKITTNNGLVYELNSSSSETRRAVPYTGVASIEFGKTEYELYKYSVACNVSWSLDKVTGPSGAWIKYNYSNVNSQFIYDYQPDHTVSVKVRGWDNEEYYPTQSQYGWEVSSLSKKLISAVTGNGSKVHFEYSVLNSGYGGDSGFLTKVIITEPYRSPGLRRVREFNLQYTLISCGTLVSNCNPPTLGEDPGYVDYSNYKRVFLRFITEKAECDQLPPYEFYYKDTDLQLGTTTLPNPNSLSIDLWGYYNGRENTHLTPRLFIYPQLSPSERYRVFAYSTYSGENYVLDGADRMVNPGTVQAGALYLVQYPSGGRTTFEFEPNDFYDSQSQQTYYTGGLRVKSVTTEDGLNASAVNVTNYSYLDTNGNSSGRVFNKPSYAMPMQKYINPENTSNVYDYNALVQAGKNPWIYLTARMDVDQADNISAVGYKRVKISTAGIGYTISEYAIPGSWNDGASGEWTPSLNKFSRSGACPSLSLFSTAAERIFPYSPNPNFFHEQGLPTKKQVFNDSNTLLEETTWTYQSLYRTGSTSAKVWGLRYHVLPNSANTAFYYSKYYLLTDVETVPLVVSTKSIDETVATKYISTSTKYYYESSYHKFLTKFEKTGSEGTVYATKFKYPQDYGTIPSGADVASNMIGKLQQDFRIALPLETYQTVKRNGGTEKVVSGQLLKLHDFGLNKPLLQQQLQLTATPLTTFNASKVNATTKVFEWDSHYEVTNTINSYSSYDMPSSSVGMDRIIGGRSWSVSGLPIVDVVNASPQEIAFADFDIVHDQTFTWSTYNPADFPPGRAGSKGIKANVLIQKNVKKNSDKYMFSFWAKPFGSTITATVKWQNTTGLTTYQTNTFTASTAENNFVYFEFPATFANAVTDFKISVQFSYSGATPGQTPTIDDVAFYPETSDVIAYNYDVPYGVRSTTSKGNSSITQYDKLGRVKLILDKDENIIQSTEYKLASNIELDAYFEYSLYSNKITFIAADNSCHPNVTYAWYANNKAAGSGTTMSYTVKSFTGTLTVMLWVTSAGTLKRYSVDINLAELVQ